MKPSSRRWYVLGLTVIAIVSPDCHIEATALKPIVACISSWHHKLAKSGVMISFTLAGISQGM